MPRLRSPKARSSRCSTPRTVRRAISCIAPSTRFSAMAGISPACRRGSPSTIRATWRPTFTAEYAGQFDVLLPGLAQLRRRCRWAAVEPLSHKGATRGRRLGSKDRHGGRRPRRLARLGYRAAVIDLTTYEEAPARIKPWIRQRTRWFKGWMRLVKLWRLTNSFSFLRRTLSIALRPSQRPRNKNGE